jgi:rhamnose transport system permease protein
VLGFNNVTLFSIAGFDLRLVFLVTLAVVVILQWSMRRLRAGRRLYAIGSNPDAAKQASLAAPRLIMFSFVGAGALAGLAGFMFMVRAGTISATAGSGLELEAVAAAVVGGVSIFGGSGTIAGAFLGAILIDTLELSLVRVPEVSEFWRDAALGILILGAVILDATLQKRFTRRLTREIRGPDQAGRQTSQVAMSRVTPGGTADA